MEREEDVELKQMYEEEKKRFEKLHESLVGKIDGQIDLDMHGNISVRSASTGNTEES